MRNAVLTRVWRQLPQRHRQIILASSVVMLASAMWPGSTVIGHQRQMLELPTLETSVNMPEFNDESVPQIPPNYQYQIQTGDTLSAVFSDFNVNQQLMYQILEADMDVLALDTLQPGHELKFWLDADGQLERLEIAFNIAEQVIYSRVEEGVFEFERIIHDGQWETETVHGEIHGSLYVSGQRAGLTAAELDQINRLFEDKINFARELRAGDRFEVLRSVQSIDQQKTGNSNIEAVRIFNRSKELNAYLFSDGNYYDSNGDSLARAFMRIPLNQSAPRISSGFNPRRKHPVTGRISPHNGTDFAVPIGTPVLAAGDGVVTRIENHPYAGKYIVIQHGGQYRTRYLHLNSFNVRKGQRVARGDVIAQSGNTGRSTGPHLHYELHINGRPVNAMRANIPMASSLDQAQRSEFAQLVEQRNNVFEQAILAAASGEGATRS